MLRGRSKQSLRVLLVLQKCGTVHKSFSCVPDQIAHWFLGIYSEQVLEYAEEGDLLGGVQNLFEDGIEDVEVGVEVDPVRTFNVCFVTLLLLVKHVKLDLQV